MNKNLILALWIHCQWKLINVLKKQIIIEKHDDLAQADALKEKIDKIMTEFLANMKKQESDWNENLIDQENENIKISDKD